MAVSADLVERLTSELWDRADVGGQAAHGFSPHAALAIGGVALVLPSDRRVAAEAMVRWTDATTGREALLRTLARVGARVGALSLIPGRRLQIRVHSEVGERPTLHEHLAGALGVPTLEISCNLGSRRPNQKPVLRLHATDGRTIGFAKVGWNDLTRALVQTEAEFLRRPEVGSSRGFQVPDLLSEGWWNGRYVAVTSPLVGHRVRRPERSHADTLSDRIAGIDPPIERAIVDGPHRASLERRLEDLPESERSRVSLALRRTLDQWGDQVLRFGRWHGDWTPWNVNTAGPVPIVWDWERTAPGVPIGFDRIHWAFHTALRAGAEPQQALLGVGMRALGSLGSRAAAAVTALYAIEMHLRFASPDSAGPVSWVEGLLDAAAALETTT